MANYICISSIRTTSETENKLLTSREMKQFCAKRVQISATKTIHNVYANTFNCRVVLNRMSEKYIQNALHGKSNEHGQKHERKPLPKVLFLLLFVIFTYYIQTIIIKGTDLVFDLSDR